MDITYTIENNAHYLVDTGSPFSINVGHSTASTLINTLVPNLLQDVSTELDLEITGLIGTDLLTQDRWHIDPTGFMSRMSDEDHLYDYREYPITTFMSLPVVNVRIGERVFTMILDTCSSLTYLRKELLTGEPAEPKTDLHPLIGRYTVASFKNNVSAFNLTKSLDVSEVPRDVTVGLPKSIDGLLGFDFLCDDEWILDLGHHTLWAKHR